MGGQVCDDGEAMTRELPEVHPDECPDCKVPAEMGYGLAAGGIGAYSYCPQCGKLLATAQDPEMMDTRGSRDVD